MILLQILLGRSLPFSSWVTRDPRLKQLGANLTFPKLSWCEFCPCALALWLFGAGPSSRKAQAHPGKCLFRAGDGSGGREGQEVRELQWAFSFQVI